MDNNNSNLSSNADNFSGNHSRSAFDNMPKKLPGDPLALTLGIVSLVLFVIGCFCYGVSAIITLILGIIGLISANKGLSVYKQNPQEYSHSSLSSVKNGRILNIVSVILSGLVLLLYLILMIFFGAFFNEYWDEISEEFGNIEREYEQEMEEMEDAKTYETTEDDWKYEEDIDTTKTIKSNDSLN